MRKIIFIFLSMSWCFPCLAATYIVDQNGLKDFNTIQAAINDANDGDEIEVAPGTYNEAINFNGKAIRLYSSAGSSVTTINGTGHYHVVQCVNGEDANTILEGFTITGGRTSSAGTDQNDLCGGGMLNYYSSPTVTNCIFNSNDAYDFGGGMYNHYNSSPIVANCTFSGNFAEKGAGMYNRYNSSPIVTNCTFNGNWAFFGGGMCNEQSSPIVTSCTFRQNFADHYGGGMYNTYISRPIVTNCAFIKNSSERFGGGMLNESDSNPIVANCTFSGNDAHFHGAGMYNRYSSPIVTNCSFTGNSAGYGGGGMHNTDGSRPILTNCILWGNTARYHDPEIYIVSPIVVTYSDIKGGMGQNWFGAGCIDADPCFVDVSNPDPNLWNLWLKPGSPCIDAGDNNSVSLDIADLDNDGNTSELMPFDMDRFPRIMDDCWTADTGNGTAPIVDMGAYEYLSSDIARSGHIDFLDFCLFATYWLDTNCGRCSGADLTCDGDVDFDDVQEFISHWMAGTQ